MTRLRSCAGCARHVFVTEQVCPFCQTQLSAAPEPAIMTVPSGASRAQRLALAAAISGTTLLGCAQTDADNSQSGSASEAGSTGSTAGSAAAGRAAPPPDGTPVPIYGAPVPSNPAQGGRAAQPRAGEGSVEVPIYGAPVAGSPATDDDAGVPEAGKSAAGSGGANAQAGKGAAGSGGANAQAGKGAAGSGGAVAVPVYGAPIPEYGAPPPPND